MNDRSKLVTTAGTGPAALAASDKINENQMSIGAALGTLAQRLNPKFKAVKMTRASAWAIEHPDTAPAVTLVAANAEHIFRYYGSNDGLFKARTQGGGSATLNWQYFVGDNMGDIGGHLSAKGASIDTNNDGIVDGFAHTIKNAGNFNTFSLTNGVLTVQGPTGGAAIGGASTNVQYNQGAH